MHKNKESTHFPLKSVSDSELWAIEDLKMALRQANISQRVGNFAFNQNLFDSIRATLSFLSGNQYLLLRNYKNFSEILKEYALQRLDTPNQELLELWYKHTILNLKRLTPGDISAATLIEASYLTEKRDIYQWVQTNLLNNFDQYKSEISFQNEAKNIPKMIAEYIKRRIFNTSPKIEGSGELNLSLEDLIDLIRAVNQRNDNDSKFSEFLANYAENIIETTDQLSCINLIGFLKVIIESNQSSWKPSMKYAFSTLITKMNTTTLGEKWEVANLINKLPSDMLNQGVLVYNMLYQSIEYDRIINPIEEICLCMELLLCQKHDGDKYGKLRKKIRSNFEYMAKNQDLFQTNLGILCQISSNLALKFKEFRKIDPSLEKILEQIDLKKIDPNQGLQVLHCLTLAELKSSEETKLSPLIRWMEETLDIAKINDKFLLDFFNIYANMKEEYGTKSLRQFDSMRNSLLRLYADRYTQFSIKINEAIIHQLDKADLLSIRFDDGSGLYDKSMCEETHEYVLTKFKLIPSAYKS